MGHIGFLMWDSRLWPIKTFQSSGIITSSSIGALSFNWGFLDCDGMQAYKRASGQQSTRLCEEFLFRLLTIICGYPKNQTTIIRLKLTAHCILHTTWIRPDLSSATQNTYNFSPCQIDRTFITVYFTFICLGLAHSKSTTQRKKLCGQFSNMFKLPRTVYSKPFQWYAYFIYFWYGEYSLSLSLSLMQIPLHRGHLCGILPFENMPLGAQFNS